MLQALIVEDDPHSLSALAEFVEGFGFRVRTAATLDAARRCLREQIPHVVLVDRRLPDGAGLDLLSELPDSAHLDVVLISGEVDVEIPNPPRGVRMLYRLEKPVDIQRLRCLIREIAQRTP
jgi:two-component system, NtrC family, response regulator HydG